MKIGENEKPKILANFDEFSRFLAEKSRFSPIFRASREN